MIGHWLLPLQALALAFQLAGLYVAVRNTWVFRKRREAFERVVLAALNDIEAGRPGWERRFDAMPSYGWMLFSRWWVWDADKLLPPKGDVECSSSIH
jgi:hypothetical protein